MSRKPRVFISHRDVPYEGGLDILKDRCELVYYTGETNELNILSRENLLEGVKDVDAILWVSRELVDKEMLDAAGSSLKVVAAMSAGYDQIDVKEIKARGIKISNTPNVLNNAVSELTIGLMLAAARRFTEGRHKIVDSKWETFSPVWMLGQDICDSVVGIVGLGGIGQAIVRRLRPFEPARIIYTGHSPKPVGKELGVDFVSLNELLQLSDFVVVACPLNDETRNMFNDEAFRKMKSNAIFINIGRGGVVDQPALVRALKSRQISAAGLDVCTPEPLPADNPLMQLNNLVIVPHLGTATVKTRTAMAKLACENILACLDGKPMPTPL